MFITHLFKKHNRSNQLTLKKPRTHVVENSMVIAPNFYVTEEINRGEFPIYLVSPTANTNQKYVMKVFPYDANNQPHSYYRNEARFIQLKHPNVICFVNAQDHNANVRIGRTQVFSYILMEYAPHGDFYQLLHDYGNFLNEKIVRTYFRQLIEGLEYLHANGVAHLDLKPENLLIGSDFSLKIADFDLSYVLGDQKILCRGTKSYRAPEIFMADTSNIQLTLPHAADIYSAGIILFALMSEGRAPYYEDKPMNGFQMWTMMNDNNTEFWIKHCIFQKKPYSFFSKNFIELFNGMVKTNPEQRLTIQQIKQTKWYNGPVYSSSKLERRMIKVLKKQQDEWKF